MWVARDKYGTIALFTTKPERDKLLATDNFLSIWIDNSTKHNKSGYVDLNINLFPSLKWGDEPIEVEIIERRKV